MARTDALAIARGARRICLVAGLYYVTARMGFALAHDQGNATLIWPPSGIALALVFLYGRSLWPAVFLGAVAATATTSAPWPTWIGIGAGNSLEAVLGATLLRSVDFRPAMSRLRDAGIFIGLGAGLTSLIGASIGIATFALAGELRPVEVLPVWLLWWLGDLGGVVVAGSLVLLAAAGRPAWSELLRRGEYWVVLLGSVSVSIAAYWGPLEGVPALIAATTPLPLIVWAGSRFGSRGAITVSFAINVILIRGTAMGEGVIPTVFENPNDAAIVLWFSGIAVSSTALVLAATMGERDDAEARYRAQEARRIAMESERVLMRERVRIAQEMHDGIGAQLASTISLLESDAEPQRIAAGLRRALDEVRIVTDSLDPGTTDLRTALEKQRTSLARMLHRTGIALAWEVTASPELDRLSPGASLHLSRILHEAGSNVVRHSGAKKMEVRIEPGPDPGEIVMTVVDDGCGIEPAGHEGRGLRNMHARAAATGGELRLLSGPTGTRIELRVPLS